MKERIGISSTIDVVITVQLAPVRRSVDHATVLQYSIGFLVIDDPCISERVAVYKFFKTGFQPK